MAVREEKMIITEKCTETKDDEHNKKDKSFFKEIESRLRFTLITIVMIMAMPVTAYYTSSVFNNIESVEKSTLMFISVVVLDIVIFIVWTAFGLKRCREFGMYSIIFFIPLIMLFSSLFLYINNSKYANLPQIAYYIELIFSALLCSIDKVKLPRIKIKIR